MMERRNSGRKPIRGTIRRTLRRCGWIHRYFDVLLVAGVLILLGANEAELLRANNSFEAVRYPILRAVCFFLMVSAPLLLLPPRWNRFYSRTVVALVALSVLLQTFLVDQYGLAMEESLITILMVSSPGETGEYLGDLFFSRAMIDIVVALALFLLWWWLSPVLKFRPRRPEKIVGVLMLCPFAVLSILFWVQNRPEEILNCATITRAGVALHGYQTSLNAFVKAASEPEIPPDLHRNTGDLLGVIVIGESATRTHHSLYGYGRRTNPELEKWRPELALFDDVIAPTVHTASALINVFSFATLQERNSPRCPFDTLARHAGFRTELLSNQLRWGEFDTPITLMFKNVDQARYLSEEEEAAPRDDRLVDVVSERIRELPAGEPVILYVHLLGSHMPFRMRYPEEDARFPLPGETFDPKIPEVTRQLTAEYDNSIRFTDRQVARLLEQLKGLGRPSFLIYFSDHGEAFYPEALEWVARDPNANESYEIPLFLWLSPEYRRERPELFATARANQQQPHQTDRLIYTLLDLAGISWNGFPESESLLRSSYRPRPRFTHEGHQPYVPRSSREGFR